MFPGIEVGRDLFRFSRWRWWNGLGRWRWFGWSYRLDRRLFRWRARLLDGLGFFRFPLFGFFLFLARLHGVEPAGNLLARAGPAAQDGHGLSYQFGFIHKLTVRSWLVKKQGRSRIETGQTVAREECGLLRPVNLPGPRGCLVLLRLGVGLKRFIGFIK